MQTGEWYQGPTDQIGNDGGVTDKFWGSANPLGSGEASWKSDSEKTSSGNGGCLYLSPFTTLVESDTYSDTLQSGVIDVRGKNVISFSFDYFNDAENNSGDSLEIFLYDQDNDITYRVGGIMLDGFSTEWRTFNANVDNINPETCTLSIRIKSVSHGNPIYFDSFNISGTSSINNADNDGIQVIGGVDKVVISGAEGEPVVMMNINGIVEAQTTVTGTISLRAAKGLHLVRIRSRIFKVIVK